MSSHQLIDRPVPAPPSAAPEGGRAALRKARARRARQTSLPARYLGYVGYFVGAGLISGAVVRHPLDPARYTRIALYGTLVFLAATVLNELVLTRDRPGLARVLVVIGASLALSFGIGMLSGGLQHSPTSRPAQPCWSPWGWSCRSWLTASRIPTPHGGACSAWSG